MRTKMLHKRSYRFLGGVLAVGLGLGACSSDTDDGITDDTTLTPGVETTGVPAAGADNGGTNDTSIGGTGATTSDDSTGGNSDDDGTDGTSSTEDDE